MQLPQYIVCFSHLRWDFVYQRPQHLMSRFAKHSVVYYFEEPVFTDDVPSTLSISQRADNLWLCVPHLVHGLTPKEVNIEIKNLLDVLLENKAPEDLLFWYYTPMALKFSNTFNPGCVVYDCMDELSAFKFAPPELRALETKLFDIADVVFTGGHSLFESKRNEHTNIHPFPSSIDKLHFQSARAGNQEPSDQAAISGFKVGFYGVLDERFDIKLIAEMAAARPEWQIILIGPIVKINPDTLPKHANIHYLGPKGYDELPLYLSGWDVALIPFVLNESTFFISPTKTPEYLAGGKPVVSTAIKDVIYEYGKNDAVNIGTDSSEFIDIIDNLKASKPDAEWLAKVDLVLARNSWDHTFSEMQLLILKSISNRTLLLTPNRLMDEKDEYLNQN
ncbi:glycosyltransferase family 1 protein [Dyadobacter arcticus]|uniref:UDP-galactopyranose mutase n=1 Tax=Dyadobacter arcticus TaxID=1078754 RepID=A0ABX0UME0_9BACT|nr:glycosyltransferase family 1 protein [Dyadobacter arcticus]NIJ52800.1 UDP-galactopyranose mutase [Dyadobacter arcticus]